MWFSVRGVNVVIDVGNESNRRQSGCGLDPRNHLINFPVRDHFDLVKNSVILLESPSGLLGSIDQYTNIARPTMFARGTVPQ
jgi:hypothetical protein